jgi:hypothetical protein
MAVMTSWLRRRGGRPRDKTRTTSPIHEAGTATSLPHERDESSDPDSTTPDPREIQAHDDLNHGRKDTGREAAIDQFNTDQVRQRKRRPLGG